MESCSVLIVGGGPAGLTIARWIGKGAIVVHKDAEIGLPIRTSGGSWKAHIDSLGIPANLYQVINTLRFATDDEERLFDFDRETAVVLDITGTYRHLAALAEAAGAEIRCSQKFTSIELETADHVVSTIEHDSHAYQIQSKVVIDASGYRRAVMSHIDPGVYDRHGIGAEYEYQDRSARRDIATLLVGGRYTNPGYGWVFPTNKQTVRVGVGHARPDTLLSPKVSLEKLVNSDYLDSIGVQTGDCVSKHGGVIPNWGPCTQFGRGRIIGVGDCVGQALPTVGEGIRYCIEVGNYVGTRLADCVRSNGNPDVVTANYTKWWNKRYRRSFNASQWLNERISGYTNADWNRGLHRLARVRSDDFARMVQADISPAVALRIAIANRDLPGKILKVLTGH